MRLNAVYSSSWSSAAAWRISTGTAPTVVVPTCESTDRTGVQCTAVTVRYVLAPNPAEPMPGRTASIGSRRSSM